MAPKVRMRFWIELGLSVSSAVCLFLTLVWRDWIELVFRVNPDRQSGSAEWTIVGLSALAVVVLSILSRHEWRRATAMA
ncbi:MAG: ABC transporter permease [Actinomycetota bacterium]|nr:ABC transporter permease [Actinomycetota bacterium]